MINLKTHKECAADDCTVVFKLYRTTDKYCSYECKKNNTTPTKSKNYTIPKQSKKMAALMPRYYKIRADFMNALDSQDCPVYPDKSISDVHHKKGRSPDAYADDWARENNIPLLLDVRFFLAVSRYGHDYIEANPKWAKEMGYSLDRLTKS